MARRILTILFYAVMVFVGLYLIANFLLHGGRWIAFIAGGMLVLFPLYLLLEDFREGQKNRG
jgi:cytochrome c biogenesis protein CcdA